MNFSLNINVVLNFLIEMDGTHYLLIFQIIQMMDEVVVYGCVSARDLSIGCGTTILKYILCRPPFSQKDAIFIVCPLDRLSLKVKVRMFQVREA